MTKTFAPKVLGDAVVHFGALCAGANIRQVTGFDDESIEALAADIAAHGLLKPLYVQPSLNDDEYIVWDGGRRFRALARLSEAGNCPSEIPVRVFEPIEPEHLAEAQLRANNYRELASGELAHALYPMFTKARRKDWQSLRDESKQMYKRGAPAAIAAAVGMSGPMVSRIGTICGWSELMHVWALCPEIPHLVMYDAARLTNLVEQCRHLATIGCASQEVLRESFGEDILREAMVPEKGDSAAKSDTSTARPSKSALRSLLKSAEDRASNSEYAAGVLAATKYALGTGPRPAFSGESGETAETETGEAETGETGE